MAGRRTRPHLQCPRCFSMNTRYLGKTTKAKTPRSRYKCEDCRKSWSPGGQHGGDRVSDNYEPAPAGDSPAKIPVSPFGPKRKMSGQVFRLFAIHRAEGNAGQAEAAAVLSKMKAAARFGKVRKLSKPNGDCAIYVREEKPTG